MKRVTDEKPSRYFSRKPSDAWVEVKQLDEYKKRGLKRGVGESGGNGVLGNLKADFFRRGGKCPMAIDKEVGDGTGDRSEKSRKDVGWHEREDTLIENAINDGRDD